MSEFSVGDKVRCVDANRDKYYDKFLEEGEIYTVSSVDGSGSFIFLEDVPIKTVGASAERFEHVKDTINIEVNNLELSKALQREALKNGFSKFSHCEDVSPFGFEGDYDRVVWVLEYNYNGKRIIYGKKGRAITESVIDYSLPDDWNVVMQCLKKPLIMATINGHDVEYNPKGEGDKKPDQETFTIGCYTRSIHELETLLDGFDTMNVEEAVLTINPDDGKKEYVSLTQARELYDSLTNKR